MQIRKAERKNSKIKLALQGPAGSGKTYSSLLLASGLTGSINKVCVIDTENGSSDLYSHLGEYKVITIGKPHSPERYIQAIEIAEHANIECIIIDSISHCWEYLVDFHAGLSGNSFTNWSKITPRLNNLISKIINSKVYVIATLRVKQDYILQDKGNGKITPEKVGLKSIQRDGIDYEFTIVFDIDIQHFTTCSKDRTGLFSGVAPFKITQDTGNDILSWCNSGTNIEDVRKIIRGATTLQELTDIYKEYTTYYSLLESDFLNQKVLLTNSILHTTKTENNGITTDFH